MKKIGLIVKEISGNRIKSYLKKNNSLFVIKYSGLSSPEMSTLRQSLLGVNAKLFVVRNTVARRTLTECGCESLLGMIEGPCGLIFVGDEPVGVSKVLCNFVKDHERLKLEGCLMQDRVLQKKDIESLAKLPSKETLRAQAVMALKSPINGVVMVLHSTLRKFVYCLDQVKNKKNS